MINKVAPPHSTVATRRGAARLEGTLPMGLSLLKCRSVIVLIAFGYPDALLDLFLTSHATIAETNAYNANWM